LALVELQIGVDLRAQRFRRILQLGRQRDHGVRSAHQEALDAGRPFVAGRQLVRGARCTSEYREKPENRPPRPHRRYSSISLRSPGAPPPVAPPRCSIISRARATLASTAASFWSGSWCTRHMRLTRARHARSTTWLTLECP